MIPQGIRRWYETMTLRERYMLVAFIWIGVLFWGVMVKRKATQLNDSLRTVKATLSAQQSVLDQSTVVADQLKLAYTKYDPNVTFDFAQLHSTVSQAARDAGVTGAVINQRPGNTTDVFVINKVNAKLTNQKDLAVFDFTYRLLEKEPYISIESVTFTPNPVNSTLITADFLISSLELRERDEIGKKPATAQR